MPVTFSDTSGHVYEPEGIALPKLRQISTIKAERGARIGRYIIASTTAKFEAPGAIWDVPCDVAFPTGCDAIVFNFTSTCLGRPSPGPRNSRRLPCAQLMCL